MGKVTLLKQYLLGDMQALYYIDEETKNVELMLLPENICPQPWDKKKQEIDSLVQLQMTGDAYPSAYAGGGTLRQGESSLRLQYVGQERNASEDKTEIITKLQDGRGFVVEHHLDWYQGGKECGSVFRICKSGKETGLS